MDKNEIIAMKEKMISFLSTLDDEDRQEWYQTPHDNAKEMFNDLLVFIGNEIIENNIHITELDEKAKEFLHKRNELVTRVMKSVKLEDK